MRTKTTPQHYFDFSSEPSLKVVTDYQEKYDLISKFLDDNPGVLDAVHQDWAQMLSTSQEGRDGFTSEQLLRALIVMFVEHTTYRDTIIRIDGSDFLRHFVRLGFKSTMDFTFLNRAFCTLSEKTLLTMNQILAGYAVEEELISGDKQRMDTTAYEANIHYPTDSSLLWDSFRTLSRLLGHVRNELPQLDLACRFHNKRVKKLATYIARNASSKAKKTKRKVQRNYVDLIESVRRIHGIGQTVRDQAFAAGFDIPSLDQYLPLVKKIIDQAHKRIVLEEDVPSDEKLYSLFEAHTELIIRGKAGKPIEFGHKILVSQTGEKFIHHYMVMGKQVSDKDLLKPAVEAHKQLFDHYPRVLSTDKGFYENMEQITSLEEIIPVVSIAKKGRRTQEEYQRETTEEFIDGQRFRAGSEGSISVLKRAFKLNKCLFKGFKSFAASVGLSVLCHNLVLLTRL